MKCPKKSWNGLCWKDHKSPLVAILFHGQGQFHESRLLQAPSNGSIIPGTSLENGTLSIIRSGRFQTNQTSCGIPSRNNQMLKDPLGNPMDTSKTLSPARGPTRRGFGREYWNSRQISWSAHYPPAHSLWTPSPVNPREEAPLEMEGCCDISHSK